MRAVLLAAWLSALAAAVLQAPVHLQVEGLFEEEAIISEPRPRFSFLHGALENDPRGPRGVFQISYRIRVTKGAVLTVWDSGNVASQSCSDISYGGTALEPFQRYLWTAEWTSSTGVLSAVASASFETGPMAPVDWQNATALQGAGRQYRLDLELPESPVWARAYVAAAGCHHLEVNGLVPVPDLRGICPWAVDPNKDVRYMTQKITSLRAGKNTFGLLAGSVMHNPSVVALFVMEYENGQRDFFTSASSGWLERDSYVTNGNAWSTTIDWSKHDPRWSHPDYMPGSDWHSTMTTPSAIVARALGTPLSTVLEEVKPTSVEQVGDGLWLYTFPKNFVGTIRVQPLVDAQTGSELSILSGEWLVPGPNPARCVDVQEGVAADVGGCPEGSTIISVTFASFGTPTGDCAAGFAINSKCHAPTSLDHVKSLCLGQRSCSVTATNSRFGGDPCPQTPKTLAAVVSCSGDPPHPPQPPPVKPTVPQISGGQQQYENHVLRSGKAEPLETLFCWHGFQYALVNTTGITGFQGHLDSIVALAINTNLSSTGKVTFGGPSSDLLNGLTSMTRASQLTNVAAYMPTDCPTREKHGWLGDALDASEQAMYNFDMRAVYEMFFQTIHDNQGPGGDIPDVVPDSLPGQGSCNDIAWTSAYPQVVALMYKYYGDSRVVERHWDSLKLYIANLIANAEKSPNNLAVCDQFQDWLCGQSMSCCSGSPAGSSCPVPATMGGFNYVLALRSMTEMAQVLAKPPEASYYASLATNATVAFHKTFYNPAMKQYGGDEGALQSLNLPALFLRSAPTPTISTDILQLLDDNIANPGQGQAPFTMRVGAVTSKFILDVLSTNGKHDTALKLATQTSEPSWGFWWKQGATTCWEDWPGNGGWPDPGWKPGEADGTRNHIFLCGGLMEWYWKHLVGLTPTSPAFATVRVAPKVRPDLGPSSAFATYRSIRGTIASSWLLQQPLHSASWMDLDVSLPVGVQSATVVVPKTFARPALERIEVSEGGVVIWDGVKLVGSRPGITSARDTVDGVEIDVTNGVFTFSASRVAVLVETII